MCCIMRGWFSALLHSNVSLQSLHTLFSFTPLLHTPSALPALSLRCFSHLLCLLWPFRLSFLSPYFGLLRTKYVTNTWNLFACRWLKNMSYQGCRSNWKPLQKTARLLNTHCLALTLTCRTLMHSSMLQYEADLTLIVHSRWASDLRPDWLSVSLICSLIYIY